MKAQAADGAAGYLFPIGEWKSRALGRVKRLKEEANF